VKPAALDTKLGAPARAGARTLPERLRELRQQRGLGVGRLAAIANVKPEAVRALEAGNTRNAAAYMKPTVRSKEPADAPPRPRMDVLGKLAAALQVDSEELFALADYEQRDRDLWRLGATIRERRSQERIAAEELAERANVSSVYLWILERGADPKTGRPSRPSADRLQRLARELSLDADHLLELAGYEAPETERQLDHGEPLNAVSQTNRIKPAVLKWLALLEHSTHSFDGWVDHNVSPDSNATPGVVELPVWLFLRHAPRRRDLVIVGVSFRARFPPAVLVKRSGRSFPDRELTELQTRGAAWHGLKVGVFGLATTPTVLLLAHLRRQLHVTPHLMDLATDGHRALADARKSGRRTVLLDVSYTAGSLFERVLRDELDLALLPRHSYVLDKRNALVLGGHPNPFTDLYFDPSPEFWARNMPQTLLVSTTRAIRRYPQLVASSLERIRRTCELSSQRATEPERDRGVPTPPALNLGFSGEVMVDDVERLAAELTWAADMLAAAGQPGLRSGEDWSARIARREIWSAPHN
jgi:transcriptional regulator with XRE-family HTH domain